METQGCVLLVPFFRGEVRLCWGGMTTQSPPTPQRPTLLSNEQSTEASPPSTKWCGLKGDN
jgi:hypothetical protein